MISFPVTQSINYYHHNFKIIFYFILSESDTPIVIPGSVLDTVLLWYTGQQLIIADICILMQQQYLQQTEYSVFGFL